MNSLVKAVLTGARSVYSVFGPKAEAKPNSDTMSLKVLWESPISSNPSLAGMNHIDKKMLVITAKTYKSKLFQQVFTEGENPRCVLPELGMSTWSIKWMTPLVVTMSFFSTILIPLTVKLSPSHPISMVLPSSVSNTDPAIIASEHWTELNRWYFTRAG